VEKQLFLRWSLRFDFVFACALRPVGGQCVDAHGLSLPLERLTGVTYEVNGNLVL
jgi:hypothetical protein